MEFNFLFIIPSSMEIISREQMAVLFEFGVEGILSFCCGKGRPLSLEKRPFLQRGPLEGLSVHFWHPSRHPMTRKTEFVFSEVIPVGTQNEVADCANVRRITNAVSSRGEKDSNGGIREDRTVPRERILSDSTKVPDLEQQCCRQIYV